MRAHLFVYHFKELPSHFEFVRSRKQLMQVLSSQCLELCIIVEACSLEDRCGTKYSLSHVKLMSLSELSLRESKTLTWVCKMANIVHAGSCSAGLIQSANALLPSSVRASSWLMCCLISFSKTDMISPEQKEDSERLA